jgi:hypothetical protein
MDNVTNDDDVIHPAIRARISRIAADRKVQITRDVDKANLILADVVALLLEAEEETATVRYVARIISAVEVALHRVDAAVQAWNNGVEPDSANIEVMARTLRVIYTGLVAARELCANADAVDLMDLATDLSVGDTAVCQS